MIGWHDQKQKVIASDYREMPVPACDYKIHIGREGKNGLEALVSASMAAKQGVRQ